MACKIVISLVSESQTGTIGNDWRYTMDVQVFGAGASQALISKGTLEVPEHTLESGAMQAPPGPPDPLVLAAGEAGGDIRVEMKVVATEVDVVKNDVGETTASFRTTCPAAGAPALSEEREISVGVDEEPSGIGTAVLTLAYRISIEHE